MSNALTSHLDVAQIALYVFWLFFAGLIFHLRQEDKREGYPLVSELQGGGRLEVTEGFPPMPPPKTYIHEDGTTSTSPQTEPARHPVGVRPAARFPGAPLEPTGNPLIDGVGPAAWAYRRDEVDRTLDGHDKITPMRLAPEYGLWDRSPDPRGMPVVGADGYAAGTVIDLWIDIVEDELRYLEMALTLPGFEGQRVLIPQVFVRARPRRGEIKVNALTSVMFADIPRLKHPDGVTRQEEERLIAYFGGGLLYATPSRMGPLL